MYENTYTLKTLSGLITTTYVMAFVMAIVFIVISLIVSRMIAFEGGRNPKDAQKRRVWFWVLAVFDSVSFFLWNLLYVADKVKGKPAVSEFLMHNGIATGVNLVFYVLLGFMLSRMLKNRKYGTIF